MANAGLKRDQASEVEDGKQRADCEPGRASGAHEEGGEHDDPSMVQRAEQLLQAGPGQARHSERVARLGYRLS